MAGKISGVICRVSEDGNRVLVWVDERRQFTVYPDGNVFSHGLPFFDRDKALIQAWMSANPDDEATAKLRQYVLWGQA
jgi:hypothetical protein